MGVGGCPLIAEYKIAYSLFQKAEKWNIMSVIPSLILSLIIAWVISSYLFIFHPAMIVKRATPYIQSSHPTHPSTHTLWGQVHTIKNQLLSHCIIMPEVLQLLYRLQYHY